MPAAYLIELDSSDDGSYTQDLSAEVLTLSWRLGMEQPYDRVAALSTAEITLRNADRRFSPEADTRLKVGQRVHVTVMEVDLARKRIGLSLKSKPDLAPRGDRPKGGEAGTRDVRKFQERNAPAGGKSSGGSGGVDWFTAAMNKKP